MDLEPFLSKDHDLVVPKVGEERAKPCKRAVSPLSVFWRFAGFFEVLSRGCRQGGLEWR